MDMNRRIMIRIIAGIGMALSVCVGLSMAGCHSDEPTPERYTYWEWYLDATQFRVVDDARQFWVEGLEWETTSLISHEKRHYELKRDNEVGDSYLRAYINGEPSDIVIRPEKDKLYGYDVIKGEEFLMYDYEDARNKPVYPDTEADVYYECFVTDNGKMVSTMRLHFQKRNELPRLELLKDTVETKLFGDSYYLKIDSDDIFGYTRVTVDYQFTLKDVNKRSRANKYIVFDYYDDIYVDRVGLLYYGNILAIDLSNAKKYEYNNPEAPEQFDYEYCPETGIMKSFSINGKKVFTDYFRPYSWREEREY